MNINRNDIMGAKASNRVSYGPNNTMTFVTVHQTGNPSKGANAEMHHRLQKRQALDYGWHWQVDDKEAIQTYSHKYSIWHAGDRYGNNNSIGVEICINQDGNYKKSVQNGAKLVAVLLKELKLPISRVVQHNNWSGKNCPAQIRAGKEGITWNKFLEMVQSYLATGSHVKPSILQIALRVIRGDFGNGKERVAKLTEMGYNYKEVQDMVNKVLNDQNKQIMKKKYHTVKKGESLWEISKKYNTSVNRLVYLNDILNPDIINTGQVIRVM